MGIDDTNLKDDYRNMLKILDYCYQINGSDDLGGLLGVLSTDIWEDNHPADIANYYIWLECAKLIESNGIVLTIISFLERLMSEFEFDLQSTTALLRTISNEEVNLLINTEYKY